MKDFIEIDGIRGEGGGQILRTSLALSLITGKPFKMVNIRARRRKPGLMRQHLTAVRAAAEVGSAQVTGDEINSRHLEFIPGEVTGGHYEFSIGSAGSASLVFQTVLPPLLLAENESSLVLEGGTHNMMAPPFDFINGAFLPQLNKTGVTVEAELDRWGFYPAGGGRFRVKVKPAEKLNGFELIDRGDAISRKARSVISALPMQIAEREIKKIREKLNWSDDQLEMFEVKGSRGPGNIILFDLEYENVTEVITAFGERGVEAERVASNGVRKVRDYLTSKAPVGEYLADQLLIPLALAGEGRLVCTELSSHTLTNIEVIGLFLDVSIQTGRLPNGTYEIRVG